MPEKKIESHINDVLVGDAQKLALNFVTYLRAQEMQFERGTGYWEDKRYWMIKYKDEYVCFILVNGYGSVRHQDEPAGWMIWSDDSGKVDWFADSPLDEHTKEIVWANVDFCGHCGGSCNGGFHKTIFGKEFDNVCNTTFRFDNPNSEAVDCAKKLVELRKNYIQRKTDTQGVKNISIQFTDICFITTDVPCLRAFYEAVFGGKAEGDEIHSGLTVGGVTFIFDHVDIAEENPTFRYIKAGGANNVIVGFNVDDVDAEYERLLMLGAEMLNQPTTHSWGARSFQFRDPDGNILNFRSFL